MCRLWKHQDIMLGTYGGFGTGTDAGQGGAAGGRCADPALPFHYSLNFLEFRNEVLVSLRDPSSACGRWSGGHVRDRLGVGRRDRLRQGNQERGRTRHEPGCGAQKEMKGKMKVAFRMMSHEPRSGRPRGREKEQSQITAQVTDGCRGRAGAGLPHGLGRRPPADASRASDTELSAALLTAGRNWPV